MAKKKAKETAPEQEGAVLNNEVETTTEVVIEEVIKDSLDAVKAEVNQTIVDDQQNGIEEEKSRLEAEDNSSKAKYAFTKDAPESFRYDGKIYNQKEVLSNEELLSELVRGKCIFIKKV